MSGSNSYYIYIDTKITGAIEQLVGYFQAQVFNSTNCIEVICKYYKEVEQTFPKYFSSNDIPFRFIKKQSDLNLMKGKVVFYLFNAQSNCRLVANRDLIHIFVTHGESHKLASIKPIVRIYDYIVTSGKVGIERYLKSGIFTPYDIESGRVITLGDTFIGRNDFSYHSDSTSIVYAPTWEGGVPEENYSSICEKTTQKIIDFCHDNSIVKIYVQPHPNLGHRKIEYKLALEKAMKEFKKTGMAVTICSKDKNPINFLKSIAFFKLERYRKWGEVKYAITDISAMEMQFVHKGIPCFVLVKNEYVSKLSIPKRLDNYCSSFFYDDNDVLFYDPAALKIKDDLFDYFFTYPSHSLLEKTPAERVSWLCTFTSKNLKEKRLLQKNHY